MGGGSYSYVRDVARKIDNSQYSREEVFSQRSIHPDMDIRGKIRECRDSEEHPETLPIIIALDVTGSMGTIPHKLVTKDFPEIMKKISDEGIAHPQVCFVGIGDQYSDDAPIQVGQFEASDELLDKWLKTIWLEGKGGGNGGESYQLAWFFASQLVSADHITKRRKKGILITIGDELVHKSITQGEISTLFSCPNDKGFTTQEILDIARKNWDVYHINLRDWSGAQLHVIAPWKEMLGNNLICTEDNFGNDIPDIIAGIIIKSAGTAWTTQTAQSVNDADAATVQATTMANQLNAHIR